MKFRRLWVLIAAALFVAVGAYLVLAISSGLGPPSGLTYMPLGDSITGADYFSTGGYRCPLQAALVNAGYKASAVGRSGFLDRWSVTDCPDKWEGHGSYTTAQIHAWFNADDSIAQLKPKIILALVGTVDVRRGNISQGPGDLRKMLTDIFAQSPDSWVVVSTIPPLGPQVPNFDRVPAYNAAVTRVVREFTRTSMIAFYTACDNLGINTCLFGDGIHPTAAGFDVLTPLWFQAIQSIAAATTEVSRAE